VEFNTVLQFEKWCVQIILFRWRRRHPAETVIKTVEIGFDLVSTTLSGYTPYSPTSDLPDLLLIEDLVQHVSVPVIAEGRVKTPEQARRCLNIGAYAVVVGGAITRPQEITQRFVSLISGP